VAERNAQQNAKPAKSIVVFDIRFRRGTRFVIDCCRPDRIAASGLEDLPAFCVPTDNDYFNETHIAPGNQVPTSAIK
jgi:hypothetical protein